ncbi:phage tail sheath subtilisin-like domain-containing protein [Solirubrobacter ginsenosidimutans]|uniref:Phage tail sheath subtilisin-like domain-containing protein n=1 Tax=Solirubrobacter ginsenosidimutans TaxID=490573 RepID=A0A9X3S640_9ACTN|nr:phage tail sheath subtilisin-like domain-containing protein [Solirubrobacter ginsenosidimutans]MDA0166277.1 phage tail sheath subtilisin-like domain-containing protein [Solirubrobacter ginsenosidimutans]
MPEYLAPGVYAEEVSFRQKTIEGVSTSTAGFVGATRFGPVSGPPALLTSFLDFERIYGGIDPLRYAGVSTTNHLAHGVRAFFENGGRRLYVARAFDKASDTDLGVAAFDLGGSPPGGFVLKARHPGSAGNFAVTISVTVGPNILVQSDGIGVLSGALPYDTVYLTDKKATSAKLGTRDIEGTYWLEPFFDPTTNLDTFKLHAADPNAAELLASNLVGVAGLGVHVVTANVTVSRLGRFVADEFWGGLAFHPEHPQALTRVFDPTPVDRSTSLFVPLAIDTPLTNGPEILELILEALPPGDASPPTPGQLLENHTPPVADPRQAPLQLLALLTHGNDGKLPDGDAYRGDADAAGNKSGLLAFEDLDDISIVAAPGSSLGGLVDGPTNLTARDVQDALLGHAERMRYRIAVLDSPNGALPDQIRTWRGRLNSKYGALYYPWVRVVDPYTEQEIITPPSGFVAGIYARSDVLRGVHKAPANEPVRLALDFEFLINRGQQEVLNPEGINCLRLIDQAGLVVWGARTVTSDPEWKYVNLRRYFAFLEHSIDRGSTWAVFEPNGPDLWANVRRTVEDFLFNEFKVGHLLGTTPEEAYFVACDRSTMTQNDLDNGRLVCLVGVSPLRPAEFVIFRIGQKTLEATRR